jgi:hypothetical protein
MSRAIRTFLPVPGDPEALVAAFTGDVTRWLPEARRDGASHHLLTLHAGAFSRHVRARIGHPWRAGATRWRSVTWDPIGDDGGTAAVERLLPSFDGELGLHVQHAGRSTLILDGRYRPPGGGLGVAVDAALLHRVASATTERLLEDVAARLAAEALLVGDPTEAVGSPRRRAPDEHRPASVVA